LLPLSLDFIAAICNLAPLPDFLAARLANTSAAFCSPVLNPEAIFASTTANSVSN